MVETTQLVLDQMLQSVQAVVIHCCRPTLAAVMSESPVRQSDTAWQAVEHAAVSGSAPELCSTMLLVLGGKAPEHCADSIVRFKVQ